MSDLPAGQKLRQFLERTRSKLMNDDGQYVVIVPYDHALSNLDEIEKFVRAQAQRNAHAQRILMNSVCPYCDEGVQHNESDDGKIINEPCPDCDGTGRAWTAYKKACKSGNVE